MKRLRGRSFPKVDFQKLTTALAKAGSGRPKGSAVIKDEDLVKALHEVSVPRGKWSRRRQQELRALSTSTRRTYLRLPKAIQAKIRLRQLQHRLRRGRLGFGRSYKRVDVCSICNAWDTVVSKHIASQWVEAERLLGSKCERALEGTGKQEVDRCERPSCVEAFVEGVEKHSREHIDCPASMELAVIGDTWERDIVPVVRDYNFHWALNAKIRETHNALLRDPGPGRTCLCFDFQARDFF